MKSKIFNITIFIFFLFALASCGSPTPEKEEEISSISDSTSTAVTEVLPNNDSTTMKENPSPIYEINTTEGTIVVRLYEETPLHRDNFNKLVSQKFYDGVLFHRVIKGFMIQTGDPLTKDPTKAGSYGTGGPGYTIPAEILPQFTHKKGALAAARRGDAANPKRESSGSQFYIVQDEGGCSHLDGQYTIFGETLEGLDVVDKIANVPANNSRPVNEVKIISITPVK